MSHDTSTISENCFGYVAHREIFSFMSIPQIPFLTTGFATMIAWEIGMSSIGICLLVCVCKETISKCFWDPFSCNYVSNQSWKYVENWQLLGWKSRFLTHFTGFQTQTWKHLFLVYFNGRPSNTMLAVSKKKGETIDFKKL